jgi:hypothetical protein
LNVSIYGNAVKRLKFRHVPSICVRCDDPTLIERQVVNLAFRNAGYPATYDSIAYTKTMPINRKRSIVDFSITLYGTVPT